MTAGNDNPTLRQLAHQLHRAESEAWKSLPSYKFQMFGYWCGIWVRLNRIGDFNRPNPFRPAVELARNITAGQHFSGTQQMPGPTVDPGTGRAPDPNAITVARQVHDSVKPLATILFGSRARETTTMPRT